MARWARASAWPSAYDSGTPGSSSGKSKSCGAYAPREHPPQGTRRPGSGPPLSSLPFVGFSRTAAERVGNATTEKSLIPELKPSFDHMVLKNSK